MTESEHSECRSLLSFLSDYIDGDLSDELCQAIEKHTAECGDCRIVVDTLRRTISLYHQTAGEPAVVSPETRAHLFKVLNLEDYLQE